MIIRLGYSWRVKVGRCWPQPWPKDWTLLVEGWRGLRFMRYHVAGIDWRYWRVAVYDFQVLFERPSSDRDGERLDAVLESIARGCCCPADDCGTCGCCCLRAKRTRKP